MDDDDEQTALLRRDTSRMRSFDTTVDVNEGHARRKTLFGRYCTAFLAVVALLLVTVLVVPRISRWESMRVIQPAQPMQPMHDPLLLDNGMTPMAKANASSLPGSIRKLNSTSRSAALRHLV